MLKIVPSLLLLASAVCAQSDILFYSFDAGQGSTEFNKYAGSAVAPPFGTIVSTNKQAWAPGLFTAALSGAEGSAFYNYVDSGWTGALQGSFSVAWFMKQRTPLPDSLAYYFFCGEGNFRAFTSGAAGTGLIVGGYGGTNLTLTKDIRTPAATRWVHVALVVDEAAMQATYYLDGIAEPPVALSAKVSVPARTLGFRVGMHTRLTTGSFWDLDDFRLVNRAAGGQEIAEWAAAAASFGTGCGATLSIGGTGEAKVGNSGFGLALTSAPNAACLFSLGASAKLLLGLVPLPLDLGLLHPGFKGCAWYSSMDLTAVQTVPGSGTAAIPLPIPNVPSLAGFRAYTQCLIFPAASAYQSSNGFLFTVRP